MSYYEGLSLIADPVHGYINFTVPVPRCDSVTEQDIIDTPWVQRLRYIYQLQSARWVFPSAEHSRFQHSLGTMHVAGKFAVHLYKSLKDVFPDLPSLNYIEALMRLSGLLHDIGHGPFGHFFDDNYLDEFGHTHESIGALIIVNKLGELIRSIRRSPSGPFEDGELLDPEHIAYIINKHPYKYAGSQAENQNAVNIPGWLEMLRPVMGGIYTADNMDYVLRDAYMCGVAVGAIDLERLIHYSIITSSGMTIHKSGVPALTMFLNARQYLYSNVYYHRTTRAIDLHLKDIFRDTIKEICSIDPSKDLDSYLHLTDWLLMETVRQWKRSTSVTPAIQALAAEWGNIIGRQIKWKMNYSCILSQAGSMKGFAFITEADLKREIDAMLAGEQKCIQFKVDMASQDPRPLNLITMGQKQIYVLNPLTGKVSAEELKEYFDFIPAKVVHCRVYSLARENNRLLGACTEKVLNITGSDNYSTNI